MFEVVGLSAEVEQVYEMLLGAGPATTKELATATGLAEAAVRAAVRSLRDLGVVSETPGSTPRYGALDPGPALDALLLDQEDRLRRAWAQAGEISEQFRQAAAGRDPAEMVEVISGTDTIVERYNQLERSARRELRILDKPPYRPGYEFANEPELDFLRAGGVARCIYETAAVDMSGRLAALDLFLTAGEEARVLPSLPTKLMLVDDRVGVVPLRLTTDVPSNSYLVVHRSALLDSLLALFETLWRLALPFAVGGGDTEGTGMPDLLERQILGLMNAGLPDQAIARHLGLSYRTLQRRIRDLMERLDAHTRYQLGSRAAARGWAVPVDGVPG